MIISSYAQNTLQGLANLRPEGERDLGMHVYMCTLCVSCVCVCVINYIHAQRLISDSL